jgi:hypothetical protein
MDQGPFTETNSHAAREEIFRRLWSTIWHVCQYTLSWAKMLDIPSASSNSISAIYADGLKKFCLLCHNFYSNKENWIKPVPRTQGVSPPYHT